MQQDILSPSYAFLDFDFSEFIDKNFDMSNELFNSPSTTNSSLIQLDDFLSCSDESELKTNYTHESNTSLYPLWTNMQNLSIEKTPPTFSCIDDFIKDPQSDLVQLVQQCHSERSLFHNLITHSLKDNLPVTPNQVLQQDLLLQPTTKQQQQHFVFDLPIYPTEKKRKSNHCTTQSQKRVSSSSTSSTTSSSSNNNNYTHSDSVNAHLLRELIRQAGRNHTQNMDFDTKTYGNYRHHPYYKPSSTLPTSRHHLPYHIQTKKITKPPKPMINRSLPKSNHHPMGRPSMYSSDISQAQLLEIQAISRAQQDFIRAREQQEAEKEMLMKHQQKTKVSNM